MRFWAVKADPDPKKLPNSVRLGKFKPPRSPNIAETDEIVLFVRTTDDIVFWAFAEVTNVIETTADTTTLDSEEDDAIAYTAMLSSVVPIKPSRSLDDFRFSLARVYRLSEPKRHFCSPYISLPRDDFEALKTNQLQWTRTSVGLLAEALPFSGRLAVAGEFIRLRQGEFRKITHSDLLSSLHSYVQRNYFELASFLSNMAKSSEPLLERQIIAGIEAETADGLSLDLHHLSPNAEAVYIGFADEGGSPFELLARQDGEKGVSQAERSLPEFKMSAEEVLRILQVA